MTDQRPVIPGFHPDPSICRVGDTYYLVTSSAGLLRGEEFVELGEVDGRYVSTEVAGGMTGRMLGAFCDRGSLVLTAFTYVGSDDPTLLGEHAHEVTAWADPA